MTVTGVPRSGELIQVGELVELISQQAKSKVQPIPPGQDLHSTASNRRSPHTGMKSARCHFVW